MKIIQMQQRREVCTDPQRRCYYGVYAKSEIVALPWENLEFLKDGEDYNARLTFWRELNDYAVSQRGEVARTEYRIIDVETP